MHPERSFHQKPKSQTSWNNVAGWYNKIVGEKGSDFHQNVILPLLIEMMQPKKGEKAIDIACGQGYLCRHLAQLGLEVTGIDASPRLIDLARKHPRQRVSIKYIVSDAAFIKEIPKNYFDAATCVLSLQNMESLGQVIREMTRVIRTGGHIYLVLNHPSFRIPRQSGWGYDEKRKLQYRRIDSYLTEQKIPIQMHPGAKPNQYTWSFHRPLQSYFEALHKNGLAVEQLTEWSSYRKSLPGKKQKTEDRARQEIPLFLAMAAVKL